MKKLFLSILLVLSFFTLTGFSEGQMLVYDEANLLTEEQVQDLQTESLALTEKHKTDFVILTTTSKNGSTTAAYADNFFDDNNFGYDKPMGDGVLFLIDMESRQIYISTSGGAIQVLTDSKINSTLDKIYEPMSDQDYYKACQTFLKRMDYNFNQWKDPANQSSTGKVKNEYVTKFENNILIYFIISLAVATIFVVIIYSGHKSKTVTTRNTYLKNNKYQMKGKFDRFTHTTTITRHIPRNDSSSSGRSGGTRSSGRSGSSTHTSRSGNTHGGGGRSF